MIRGWNRINRYRTRGKGRRPALLLALLATLLTSAGCRFTAAPADLLQKPAIATDKEELATAIMKALPQFSVLMLPHRDEYKEAIRLKDLTGDGVDEAIVTYYNEFSTPEIMVLRKTEFGWRQSVLVEQPLARDIAWLRIVDLDGDGGFELLTGWVGAFDNPNLLELHSFQSKAVRNDNGMLTLPAIQSLPYNLADASDLDNDGKEEVIVLDALGTSGEHEVPSYYLSIYGWNGGSLEKRTILQMPQGVDQFEHMLSGRISDRHYGILLEGGTGAHSMLTYMYAWENGELKLIYPDEKRGEDGLNGTPTRSGDMNGDGIIELNLVHAAPGFADDSYANTMWINEWVQWNGRDSYKLIAEQYLDNTYGMQVNIPKEWRGHYSLKKPKPSTYGIVTFEYWNEKTQASAELVTVYVVPLKQWGAVESAWKDEHRPYRLIASESGNAYLVSFAQEAQEQLDEEDQELFLAMRSIEEHFTDYITIVQDDKEERR